MSVTTEPTESMLDRAARLRDHVDELRAHGNVTEAEAAQARLTAIMVIHSINLAQLRDRDGSFVEPIVVVKLPFTGIYRVVLAPYLAELAALYRVVGTAFTHREGNTTFLSLVGLRGDVEQLRAQLEWVTEGARRGMNQWWADLPPDQRPSGMAGYKARRQFIISFIRGIGARVASQRDATVAATSDAQVAVRSQQERVDEFVATNFRLRKGRRSMLKGGSIASANAGFAAGQRAGDDAHTGSNRPRQLEARRATTSAT